MWAQLGRVLVGDGPMGGSLAFILLVVAWVATWRPQIDPDAWWHIATGDAIATAGAIPEGEPFSWLTAGDRFVAHSWLWDVLLSQAFALAGATGTSLLVLPATALVVVVLWALIGAAAPAIPPLGRSAFVVVATVASYPLWAPRSQTLDLLFVLATTLLALRYLRIGDRRGLMAIPVIAILWANLHGSAILALFVTLAIAMVAAPIGARIGSWPQRPVGPLVLSVLASLVAAALNPYGPALFAYPFDRAVASAFVPDIVEWRSPEFGNLDLLVARLLLAGALVLLAWPRRKGDPYLSLSAAAWTFLALGSVRFLPIAVAMLVVALAAAVGPAVAGRLADYLDEGRPPASTRTAVPFMVVALIVALGACVVGWSFISPPSQDVAIAARSPVAAVEALERGPCEGRLLPAYTWSGFAIHATGRQVGAYGNSPERPVSEQAAVEAVTTDPRPWLDGHGVEIVLMPATGPLSHWLDEAEAWRLAYRDAQSTVHVRASRTDCQLGAADLRPSVSRNQVRTGVSPRRIEHRNATIGANRNG
jgi:hypothetical protein